jgi:hypothetical protein
MIVVWGEIWHGTRELHDAMPRVLCLLPISLTADLFAGEKKLDIHSNFSSFGITIRRNHSCRREKVIKSSEERCNERTGTFDISDTLGGLCENVQIKKIEITREEAIHPHGMTQSVPMSTACFAVQYYQIKLLVVKKALNICGIGSIIDMASNWRPVMKNNMWTYLGGQLKGSRQFSLVYTGLHMEGRKTGKAIR